MVETLQSNGYPMGFIWKQTCPMADMTSRLTDETRATATLTYISDPLESIRRVPSRLWKQELVHPEDPVPVSNKKKVVYSVRCAEHPRTEPFSGVFMVVSPIP